MTEVDVASLKRELMYKKSGQKNLTLKELVELIDKHTVSKDTTKEGPETAKSLDGLWKSCGYYKNDLCYFSGLSNECPEPDACSVKEGGNCIHFDNMIKEFCDSMHGYDGPGAREDPDCLRLNEEETEQFLKELDTLTYSEETIQFVKDSISMYKKLKKKEEPKPVVPDEEWPYPNCDKCEHLDLLDGCVNFDDNGDSFCDGIIGFKNKDGD